MTHRNKHNKSNLITQNMMISKYAANEKPHKPHATPNAATHNITITTDDMRLRYYYCMNNPELLEYKLP